MGSYFATSLLDSTFAHNHNTQFLGPLNFPRMVLHGGLYATLVASTRQFSPHNDPPSPTTSCQYPEQERKSPPTPRMHLCHEKITQIPTCNSPGSPSRYSSFLAVTYLTIRTALGAKPASLSVLDMSTSPEKVFLGNVMVKLSTGPP